MKLTRIFTLVEMMFVGGALWNQSARADDTVASPAMTPAATATTPAAPVVAPDPEPWQFGVIIPLWAPKIDGNTTVLGHQENTSVSFNHLRQHLDSIFSLGLDARKGKFDFYGDVGYMKFSFSQSASFPDGHVHVAAWTGLKFLVSDLGAGYTLLQTESDHPFILEGTVGVRYWYVSTPVTLSAYDNRGNEISTSFSKPWDWADPVLGLRGSQYFTRKFHLDFAADGGGFDINHSTDWTWSATGVLTYDFAKWFSLSAGYKALAVDQAENKSTGQNGVNLIFNGALVTATFTF